MTCIANLLHELWKLLRHYSKYEKRGLHFLIMKNIQQTSRVIQNTVRYWQGPVQSRLRPILRVDSQYVGYG